MPRIWISGFCVLELNHIPCYIHSVAILGQTPINENSELASHIHGTFGKLETSRWLLSAPISISVVIVTLRIPQSLQPSLSALLGL